MDNSPLVTIVMATFNGERFLYQQISSILNGSYKKIELVIIDDCSTDDTLKIINKFIKTDSRIYLEKFDRNLGAVKAFERGIAIANGEFIALSDQDDVWHDNKIEHLINLITKFPEIDLIHSDLSLIDENDMIINNSMWAHQNLPIQDGKPFKQLIYLNFVTGCSCLFRKKLAISAIPFPEDCIMHDWWLAIVASRSKSGGILSVKNPLISYRQHSSNVIGAHSGSFFSAILRAPNLYQREKWYKKNYLRLVSYNERYDLWNDKETFQIKLLSNTFKFLKSDRHNSFICRIKLVKNRLYFASEQIYIHKIFLFITTLFPKVVDFMNFIFPFVGSKSKKR